MKLVFFLISLFVIMPAILQAANFELKKFNCEVTFKEPVIGFIDKVNSIQDTQSATSVVHDVLAINSAFAFQKIVDKEVKAEIDEELTVNTGLYVDNADEAMPRKKLYKEYKSIVCN